MAVANTKQGRDNVPTEGGEGGWRVRSRRQVQNEGRDNIQPEVKREVDTRVQNRGRDDVHTGGGEGPRIRLRLKFQNEDKDLQPGGGGGRLIRLWLRIQNEGKDIQTGGGE
jgi:hypothetical protein